MMILLTPLMIPMLDFDHTPLLRCMVVRLSSSGRCCRLARSCFQMYDKICDLNVQEKFDFPFCSPRHLIRLLHTYSNYRTVQSCDFLSEKLQKRRFERTSFFFPYYLPYIKSMNFFPIFSKESSWCACSKITPNSLLLIIALKKCFLFSRTDNM